MNSWYYIKNMDIFIDKIREFSFNKFVEVNNSHKSFVNLNNNENVDNLISFSEAKNIIIPLMKKYKSGFKISEKKVLKIVEKLNSRMVSNSLLSLVSEGILESAFDDELNDFVFWEKQ